MIHHREGMNRSTFYGSICTSFKARPATVSSSTGVNVAASVGESASLEPQVDIVLSQVVTQTATAFPAVTGDFEKKWNAWQVTWHSTVKDPKKFESSSTKMYAAGPEWSALVAMGTKILPEVVDKLAQKQNVIGVWLCKLFSFLLPVPSRPHSEPFDTPHMSYIRMATDDQSSQTTLFKRTPQKKCPPKSSVCIMTSRTKPTRSAGCTTPKSRRSTPPRPLGQPIVRRRQLCNRASHETRLRAMVTRRL